MLLMYGSCRCKAARLMSSPLAVRQLLLPAEVAVIVPYGHVSSLIASAANESTKDEMGEKKISTSDEIKDRNKPKS